MAYLNVRADELNIGDEVRGRGRLSCNIEDHPTLEGFVLAVFDEGELVMLPATRILRVKCDDDE